MFFEGVIAENGDNKSAQQRRYIKDFDGIFRSFPIPLNPMPSLSDGVFHPSSSTLYRKFGFLFILSEDTVLNS